MDHIIDFALAVRGLRQREVDDVDVLMWLRMERGRGNRRRTRVGGWTYSSQEK